MSEIDILIARKVSPESIREALPRTKGEGPGFSYPYYYKRHWTGKTSLHVIYENHEMEGSMFDTLKNLFAEGKIDRIEHEWTTESGTLHGWFALYGAFPRTFL